MPTITRIDTSCGSKFEPTSAERLTLARYSALFVAHVVFVATGLRKRVHQFRCLLQDPAVDLHFELAY